MKFLVEGAKPHGPVYSFTAAGPNLPNAAPPLIQSFTW